jgi:ERCC4-type nuclease
MSRIGAQRRVARADGYRGYAEIAARRVWRLAGLSSQEELFTLSDEQLLAIPDVGQKTLEAIRRLQTSHGHRPAGNL